jgi:hypothetical protein
MRFTPFQLPADDTRNGAVLLIHNTRVVHSRRGWTKGEAIKAVADAKRGIMYLREDIDSEVLPPLPAGSDPRRGVIFDSAPA